MMNADELIKVMEKFKELGLSHLKTGDIELGNAPKTEQPTVLMEPSQDLEAEDIVKPMSVFDEMTDDEVLYYATPYYEELQNQKELQKKKLSEDPE